jgi:hypothetical protein
VALGVIELKPAPLCHAGFYEFSIFLVEGLKVSVIISLTSFYNEEFRYYS